MQPSSLFLLTALATLLFSVVHLGIGRLSFLDGVPRSRWLSISGRAAVAYVFLHLLPELSAHQRALGEDSGAGERDSRVWLAALVGLALFYGLERHARRPSGDRANGLMHDAAGFWLHAGSFAVYNALVAYLLVRREQPGLRELLLYVVAIALHFVANDHGLREHYRERYDALARWLFVAALFLGWLLAPFVALPRATIAMLFAFLGGGIVLNVLKEELPQERESAFLPFLVGAAAYGALLLLGG